jgi:hypothetical protein
MGEKVPGSEEPGTELQFGPGLPFRLRLMQDLQKRELKVEARLVKQAAAENRGSLCPRAIT